MKDLILLHGALGSSKEFDPLVPLLEKRFKVHRFDMHGHGTNPVEKTFTMESFADDLQNYINDNGLEKPQLFGYSMGGYVGYTLTLRNPEALGDIMSLGTMLKWDPLRAKLEHGKMNPEKIEEKVPKFGEYLNSLHTDWKANMRNMSELIIALGNGAALTFDDFAKVKNKVYIGLGDMDEMVSCQETLDVDAAILNSHYYKLPNSRHPLAQLDHQALAEKIIEFLS